MAKKSDFRPDKPRGGLLSQLYLTKIQRRELLKWCLYGLVLLALSVLQDVILSRVRLFGASTELVPCGIFLICILEGTQTGSVFALVSALAYLFTGTAPGTYAMVFIVVLAVGMCVLRQAYLQEGFATAILCTAAAMLMYELAVFAIGLFLGLTRPERLGGFCITAALSMLAAPVLYPAAISIGSLGGNAWKE